MKAPRTTIFQDYSGSGKQGYESLRDSIVGQSSLVWEPYLGDGSDGDLSTTGNLNYPNVIDTIATLNYRNLTINAGHIFQLANRGVMFLYVQNNLIINGTLSGTARGCYGYFGTIKVPIKKINGIDIYDYLLLPSEGGYHAFTYPTASVGFNGSAGLRIGETGGGGGGGVDINTTAVIAGTHGQMGHSSSGGCGGGGNSNSGYSFGQVYDGLQWGRNGGQGRAAASTASAGYGGAGNPGGLGYYNGAPNASFDGVVGTGSAIVIIAKNISGNGSILNQGSSFTGISGYGDAAGGGGSGGGSVTIRYVDSNAFSGTIDTSGGIGKQCTNGYHGGNGGLGFISIQQLS